MRAVVRFLVSVKNLGQYQKLACDKIMKKKRTLRQTFRSVLYILELQCLVDDLVYFLKLSRFGNAYLP